MRVWHTISTRNLKPGRITDGTTTTTIIAVGAGGGGTVASVPFATVPPTVATGTVAWTVWCNIDLAKQVKPNP